MILIHELKCGLRCLWPIEDDSAQEVIVRAITHIGGKEAVAFGTSDWMFYKMVPRQLFIERASLVPVEELETT